MNDIHVRFTFDDTSDYRFLEVDASAAPQLRAILQQATATTTVSDPLYINTVQSDPVAAAASSGPAYLCIPPNTCLSLRKVEYSNSLFLSRDITTSSRKRDRTDEAGSLKEEDEKGHEPSSAPVVQRAQTWEERLHRVFECVPSRPHVSTALELLAKNFMTLDELESASNGGEPETFAAAGGATHGRKSGYYTLIDLLRVIPCTFAQLTKFLVDQGAVVYRGFVRLLHPLIVRECLASVLLQVESDRHRLTVQPQQQQRQEGEEGGGVAASPSSSCLIVRWDRLVSYFCPSIYPTIVLDVVQRVYTDAVDEMPAAENSDPANTNEALLYRKLRLGKCLIVLAEKILQSSLEDEATMFGSAEGMQEDGDDEVWGTRSAATSGKSSSQQTLKDGWMNLPEFVTQWRSKMPISVLKADMFRTVLPTPSSAGGGGPSDDALDVALLLPLLRGCVVVRQQGSGIAMTSQIRWCAAAALPPRIPDRLRSLFAFTGENSRWQAADLKPFIEPLLEPGVTFEQSVNKVLKDHRMPGAPVSYSLLS